MAPRKPSGPTKQERVYAAVRERIRRGTYGPGYRVVIDSLAEEFAVSALPVREAFRRLEAEGPGRLPTERRCAGRSHVFVQIPDRGSASVAEHRALIDLLANHASPDEIETAAREHKLRTVASFREWELEHDAGAGAVSATR